MSEKSKREIDKQALDESIAKWEAIVGEYEKGNEIDIVDSWENDTDTSTGLTIDNCPLCIIYYRISCKGCPLRVHHNRCGDTGSAWLEYDGHRDLPTATAMLNKLKELRRAYD